MPLILLIIFSVLASAYGRLLDKSAEDRKKRRPFSNEVRLMRRPGERLFKQIEEIKDEIAIRFFAIPYFGVAAVIVISFLSPLLRMDFLNQIIFMTVVAIVYTVFLAISFRRMAKLVDDRRRKYLGYFGECAVAEYLDSLKHDKYYVFHDVPCAEDGREFNIDHVVVGPTGLFAIETKTYSKLWPRDERRSEKIEFDGEQINFSWGAETKEIRQATRQAVWLASQFRRKYFAQPILAFPGWKVEEREIGNVWILYPAGLADAITKRSKRSLDTEAIEDVRSYLAKVCRDVEY